MTIFTAVLLLAFACRSRKSAQSPAANSDEQMLKAVQAKIPGTTQADMETGRIVFNGPCTRCHGAKDVSGYEEGRLRDAIDRMSKMAKLNPAEKDAVWKYALGLSLRSQ
jgi:cytochrome c5